MTTYLLDTNAVIFTLAAPDRLRPEIRRKLEAGTRFVSVLAYWEVVLKTMKGKLDFGDPRVWWPESLSRLGASSLPLAPDHIAAICTLPPVHQDPFDRALIAQAMVEEMTIVTADTRMAQYGVSCLQIR